MGMIKAAVARRASWERARAMLAMSVVALATVCAAVGVRAQGFDDRGDMGGGMRHHGSGGGGMMFGGPMGGHGIDRMLDGLGVTDAQRAQIRQISMAAAADVRAQREAGRALHEKGMQLFGAPTVDAAAAEQLRQQMVAQQDQSSKRMLQAMLDMGKVLTPEQRAKLAQRAQERQAIARERMQREQREHAARPRQQP